MRLIHSVSISLSVQVLPETGSYPEVPDGPSNRSQKPPQPRTHTEPVEIEGLPEGLPLNRWTTATIGQRRHVVTQVGPGGATLLFTINALTLACSNDRRWRTPTDEQLAKLTGMSVGTIRRKIPELKRAALLKVHGRGRNRIFEVLPLANLEDPTADGPATGPMGQTHDTRALPRHPTRRLARLPGHTRPSGS